MKTTTAGSQESRLVAAKKKLLSGERFAHGEKLLLVGHYLELTLNSHMRAVHELSIMLSVEELRTELKAKYFKKHSVRSVEIVCAVRRTEGLGYVCDGNGEEAVVLLSPELISVYNVIAKKLNRPPLRLMTLLAA